MARRNNKPRPNYNIPDHINVALGDTDEERALKDALKKYREEHKKPWYL